MQNDACGAKMRMPSETKNWEEGRVKLDGKLVEGSKKIFLGPFL
jgi:hypothetical protein